MADGPPTKPAPFSRALLIAGMVSVLYGAILVAVDGIISLASDRDVITEPEAGPLIGPIMAVVAIVVLFFSILDGLRPTSGRARLMIGRALSTTLLIYLLSPLAGSIGYALGQPQLASAIPFYLRYLLSPFVVASALIAFLPVVFLPWIGRARSGAR